MRLYFTGLKGRVASSCATYFRQLKTLILKPRSAFESGGGLESDRERNRFLVVSWVLLGTAIAAEEGIIQLFRPTAHDPPLLIVLLTPPIFAICLSIPALLFEGLLAAVFGITKNRLPFLVMGLGFMGLPLSELDRLVDGMGDFAWLPMIYAVLIVWPLSVRRAPARPAHPHEPNRWRILAWACLSVLLAFDLAMPRAPTGRRHAKGSRPVDTRNAPERLLAAYQPSQSGQQRMNPAKILPISLHRGGFAPSSVFPHAPMAMFALYGYDGMPMLNQKPASILREPELPSRAQAHYGRFAVGKDRTSYLFAVYFLDGQEPRLYFDRNHNGDLTDDGGALESLGTRQWKIRLPFQDLFPEIGGTGQFEIGFRMPEPSTERIVIFHRTTLKGTVSVEGSSFDAYIEDQDQDFDFTNDGIYVDATRVGRWPEYASDKSSAEINGKSYRFDIRQ